MIKKTLTLFALTLISSQAYSDELAKAGQAYCQKMKTCAIKEMESDPDATPESKEMMANMMDNICASVEQQYQHTRQAGYEELLDAATTCVQSMADASCEQLNSGEQTAECKTFEEKQQTFANQFIKQQ